MRGYRRPYGRTGGSLDMPERLISAASYLTMGLAGFIWIIISAVTGKVMRPFVKFHIFQSIFIAVIVYLFNIVMGIFLGIIMYIPLIKTVIGYLVFWVAQYPVVFEFSILHSAFILLIAFLSWSAFVGKQPEIPWVSRTVKQLI